MVYPSKNCTSASFFSLYSDPFCIALKQLFLNLQESGGPVEDLIVGMYFFILILSSYPQKIVFWFFGNFKDKLYKNN